MRALLDLIRFEAVLVIHDSVVRRFDMALETCMRLEVEVKIEPEDCVSY